MTQEEARSDSSVRDARADAALAALERYLDLREQFGDDDEEGWSGVYWSEVQAARNVAVLALADLAAGESASPGFDDIVKGTVE